MTLPQGTRLGPYRIEEPIGAGGMGAVYRAHDTRLDRTVAIKVLSSALAGDAQLRLRFEREAKTISSLNHPNICTLFDVGETRVESASGGEDIHYLVMEHIEGETLADRLVKGALPLDEVIRRGSEIADALDRAHRHGIVHRDIKPGNIMLTRSGAKLLDFGLSRHQAAAPQVPADDLTAHKPLTQEGTILGTWLYMAPEQLDGAAADARTDIFAFGCVLYEMATGKRAFEGKSRSSLIAAIVSSQPRPISEFQPLAPPALEQIIRKCLEKDPEERWQSVRDLRAALQWLGDAGSQAGVPKAIIGARKRSKRLLEALAIAGWIVAAAAAVWMLTHRGDEAKLVRSEVVIPRDIGIDVVIQGAAVLSPGGDRIVFRSGAGEFPLAIRDLVGGDTRVIDGTNGAEFPFWSPDGRWLAYFADGKLKKIEARGGPVQAICDAPAGRGGAWSTAGWIVLAPDIDGPLVKVSENGGTPEAVTLAAEEMTHRNPFFLADGRRFLFSARDRKTDAAARVMLGQIDNRSSREIVANGSNPQAAGGYLLYSRDGNLIAQRFDDGKATVAGPLVPIAEAIDYYNPRDLANYSVNESGTLLYRKIRLPPRELVWFGRDGRELERVSDPAQVEEARLARDGRTVVMVRSEVRGNASDIWLHELDRRQSTRSTFTSTDGVVNAAVSPDGERLAVFSYGLKGGNQLWIQQVAGAGAEQTLSIAATVGLAWTGHLMDGISSEARRTPAEETTSPGSPSTRREK